MVTPHVTEILPPWRIARSARGTARNRATGIQPDLVIASVMADGRRAGVYPRSRATGRDRSGRRI
jgi:hypothetical protein